MAGGLWVFAVGCIRRRRTPFKVLFSYLQDEASTLARYLQLELKTCGVPRARVHLQVDPYRPAELRLNDIAHNSERFCALCTNGFFLSPSCLLEVCTAMDHKLPIVCIFSTSLSMASINERQLAKHVGRLPAQLIACQLHKMEEKMDRTRKGIPACLHRVPSDVNHHSHDR